MAASGAWRQRDRDELVAAARDHLAAVLAAMAGPDAAPRGDQSRAVEALVADQDRVLVVQATGWGKSAVYWAATAAIRALGGGPTFVDVTAARPHARPDRRRRTGRTAGRHHQLHQRRRLGRGARLDGGGGGRRTAHVTRAAGQSRVRPPASDHGGRRRTDGDRRGPLHLRLGLRLPARLPAHVPRPVRQADSGAPVLATTATANERVTTDMAGQLGEATVVLRGGLARSSLRLAVLPGLGPLERYAWTRHRHRRASGSGIVYVPTVAETRTAGGLPPSPGPRWWRPTRASSTPPNGQKVEDDLRANELKAVVATSALGMGYDKPDLGFCVHVGSPDSPVAYYQQVGRAGRAIETPTAVLLPAETDERIWRVLRHGHGARSRPRGAHPGGASATVTSPDERARPRIGHRPAAGSHRAAPAGDRRRGRGRARRRRLGGHRRAGYSTTREVGRGAAVRPGEADIMRAYAAGPGLSDGVPAAGPRRPRSRPLRSVLGVHRSAPPSG